MPYSELMILVRRWTQKPLNNRGADTPASGVPAPAPDAREHANRLYLAGLVNTSLLLSGWITS
jgi:hypothetical protein